MPPRRRVNAAPRMKKTEAGKLILLALKRMGRPASAYEIQAYLTDQHHLAPATIYRVLDMLIEDGSAHKIQSLNAYVACRHVGHADRSAFAICDDCGSVTEICGTGVDEILEACSRRCGFTLEESDIELHGSCQKCRAAAKREGVPSSERA